MVECFLDNVSKGLRCVCKSVENLINTDKYVLITSRVEFVVVRLVFPIDMAWFPS